MCSKDSKNNNGKSKGPTKPDRTRQLSDRQSLAIPIILSGKTDSEVAEAVGVTRQTVNFWKNQDVNFQAEWNCQKKDINESGLERIGGLLSKAVDVVESNLDSEDPKVRMEAAKFYFKELYMKPTGHTTAEEIENDLKFMKDIMDLMKW